MTRYFWIFFAFLIRLVLSLRYKIEVRGLDRCNSEHLKNDRGILFLPNHPAVLDPLFLILLLWPRFQLRPVVVEYIYRTPWLRFWMKVVRALPIPNFETSVNQIKIRKAQRAVVEIAEQLKRKENFLLYPSGKVKLGGQEIIGGASAAHEVIQEYPDVNIVLIRTTGFWGSRFSRALTGRSPDLKDNILIGIKKTLKSLIFFLPRRRILVELETQPPDFPRLTERLDLNRYIEQWYNRYEDDDGAIRDKEPIKLVSYSCWYKDLPSVFQFKQRSNNSTGATISPKMRAKIYAEICKIIEKPGLEIRPEMNLATDLGMDSLQIAELISFVGQNDQIEDLHPEDFETVQDVLEIAQGARISDRPPIDSGKLPRWPEEENRPAPFPIMGRTIPEAFLRTSDAMGDSSACADDAIGVISYKQLKLSALVLAEEFRSLPYEYIGVMLPATAAAFIVVLAIQLAGKTPVMLNWTLGPRHLDGMSRLSGVGTVITSWRFLERVSHVDFGSLVDSVQLLEDIRQNISIFKKLRGALRSRFSAKTILWSLGLRHQDKNHNAVILFTSGTEAIPKGVPLSHDNILSNLREAMKFIELNQHDALYGVLPPFHSFGFSVCGMFPLLCGVKVAFYPDPTDSFALAEGIHRWKITIFCSAPSFLKGLFQAAKNDQLMTIRYFVTGAEKTPRELYERVEKLGNHSIIIEGYGITECSPIISLTIPNTPPKGVGRLLPNMKVCIIHPTTLALLPSTSEGEICVRGPNVFSGYLGNPRSAFVEIDNHKWYRTGDIGHLDDEENLIISGRLKRFAKVGGEMISLGAIEDAIYTELIRQQRISIDVPSLALVADENDSAKAQLVLFTTFSAELNEINEILRQAGFSRLIKISAIRSIHQIPLLGIGKTDYRSLQTMIA
jgi:long-chain-fatty-acid--[acyl-carrier-protein] ligase